MRQHDYHERGSKSPASPFKEPLRQIPNEKWNQHKRLFHRFHRFELFIFCDVFLSLRLITVKISQSMPSVQAVLIALLTDGH